MKDMSNYIDNDMFRTVAPNIFCRSCASPLVQAVDWEQEGDSQWGVRLWCPECGFEQAAVLDRPQLTYLALAIEEGFARMLDALAQINAIALTSADHDLVQKAQTDRIEPAGC
jgi:hypothetical protein